MTSYPSWIWRFATPTNIQARYPPAVSIEVSKTTWTGNLFPLFPILVPHSFLFIVFPSCPLVGIVVVWRLRLWGWSYAWHHEWSASLAVWALDSACQSLVSVERYQKYVTDRRVRCLYPFVFGFLCAFAVRRRHFLWLLDRWPNEYTTQAVTSTTT